MKLAIVTFSDNNSIVVEDSDIKGFNNSRVDPLSRKQMVFEYICELDNTTPVKRIFYAPVLDQLHSDQPHYS